MLFRFIILQRGSYEFFCKRQLEIAQTKIRDVKIDSSFVKNTHSQIHRAKRTEEIEMTAVTELFTPSELATSPSVDVPETIFSIQNGQEFFVRTNLRLGIPPTTTMGEEM